MHIDSKRKKYHESSHETIVVGVARAAISIWIVPGAAGSILSAGGVVDIPADDTASDGSWVVFLGKHDGAANQSLVSFEVLQESILREGCLTSLVSLEGNDLSVVVRRGQALRIPNRSRLALRSR